MSLGDYPSQTPLTSAGDSLTNSRRISTRSIKRKKFDDELVESSLVKSERVRLRQQSSTDIKPAIAASSSATVCEAEYVEIPIAAPVEKKKISKVTLLNQLIICLLFHFLHSGILAVLSI